MHICTFSKGDASDHVVYRENPRKRRSFKRLNILLAVELNGAPRITYALVVENRTGEASYGHPLTTIAASAHIIAVGI